MTSVSVDHPTVAANDAPPALTKKDFDAGIDVRWCPGCGDYAILAAVQKTMPLLGVPREKIVFVSGIGCSSRFPYYMNTYGFHTIHGRAPAIATGLKSYRPDLHVWVVTGDGDGLSIGGNHLMHAMRRNVDIKIMLFNNKIYGLTKGQYSPTSDIGTRTKSTPIGSIDTPFKPLSLAIGAGATFVARAADTDAKLLPQILQAAHEHKGTAFIEILQNCPVFNDGVFDKVTDKKTKPEMQLQLEHGKPMLFAGGSKGVAWVRGKLDVVEVGEGKAAMADILVHDAHDPDPTVAFALAQWEHPAKPVPMGILRAVERPTYDDSLRAQITDAASKGPADLQALVTGNDTWMVA